MLEVHLFQRRAGIEEKNWGGLRLLAPYSEAPYYLGGLRAVTR